jgi:hypothetical protein
MFNGIVEQATQQLQQGQPSNTLLSTILQAHLFDPTIARDV